VVEGEKESMDEIAKRTLLALSNSQGELSLLPSSSAGQPSTPLFGNSANSSIVNSPTTIFENITTPLFGGKAMASPVEDKEFDLYGEQVIGPFELIKERVDSDKDESSPVTFRSSLDKSKSSEHLTLLSVYDRYNFLRLMLKSLNWVKRRREKEQYYWRRIQSMEMQ